MLTYTSYIMPASQPVFGAKRSLMDSLDEFFGRGHLGRREYVSKHWDGAFKDRHVIITRTRLASGEREYVVQDGDTRGRNTVTYNVFPNGTVTSPNQSGSSEALQRQLKKVLTWVKVHAMDAEPIYT